jgi:hypothetical protein
MFVIIGTTKNSVISGIDVFRLTLIIGGKMENIL